MSYREHQSSKDSYPTEVRHTSSPITPNAAANAQIKQVFHRSRILTDSMSS